ncbi:diacylglycerol/lipid kinase family protein [Luteolibacter marinus]|uniref:diacylglycerol/lipid kinase family protein n=1 Tax=Luteolibacter marinus TaxID=2776705 RepID=UPI0018683B6B|nr:diacylglycerol kinase family protein [Luteolibacter marinus]
MARFLLLLNRRSGGNDRGTDPRNLCRKVEEIFQAEGHEIESRLIEPRFLEPAIRQALADRPDAVIAAGGDGTVSAAARQLGGSDIALGILPLGTFNLAARDLGVPLDLEDAARFLAKAEAHRIDVLDVNGHSCLCTTIIGFYPEFARAFEKRDHGGYWWRKALKLVTRLPATFARSRAIDLSWQGDDASGSTRTKFSAFVPGRYAATTGIVPARTGFRSGQLTAYIGRQKSAATAVRAMLDYIFGRQEENPELTLVESPRLELRGGRRKQCPVMIDGEITRLPFPLQLEIRPGHLKVLTTAETLAGADPS